MFAVLHLFELEFDVLLLPDSGALWLQLEASKMRCSYTMLLSILDIFMKFLPCNDYCLPCNFCLSLTQGLAAELLLVVRWTVNTLHVNWRLFNQQSDTREPGQNSTRINNSKRRRKKIKKHVSTRSPGYKFGSYKFGISFKVQFQFINVSLLLFKKRVVDKYIYTFP